MRKRITIGSITTLACVALIASTSAQHADAFPLNGSLERAYRGTPFGWEKTGGWAHFPLRSYEGKAHFVLRKAHAEPGDELLSRSIRLISPGETLTLSAAYQSSDVGLSIGLVFTDALGRSLGERWDCPLPPADEWTPFATEFQMDPLLMPDGADGVKVSVLVDREEIEARIDAIRLEGSAREATRLFGTAPIPTAPWQPQDLLGPLSAEVAIDADRCEPGVEEPVTEVWLSEPLAVHGTYPHTAHAALEVEGEPGARAFLVLRALGEHTSEILWQEAQQVSVDEDGWARVELPALFVQSQFVHLQVGHAVESTSPAVARMVNCGLLPVPFSVDVHGVRRLTEFETPGDVDVFVSAVNNVGAELTSEAMISVADSEGDVVHRESREIRMRGRSAASFSVRPRLPSAGEFVLRMRFVRDDVTIGTGEFEFRVLE